MNHPSVEWPTLIWIVACHAVWALAALAVPDYPWIALPVLVIFTAFHTSLQHEVLHGHPTRSGWFNELLVSLPLILVLPYRRYKQLHLKHHNDSNLTDPYEDPESYFWPEHDVQRMGTIECAIRGFNNTFLGRMLVGPALTIIGFIRTEWPRLVTNEKGVRMAWALHILGLVPVVWYLWIVCGVPLWLYFVAVVYPALALISVRSFAEHQAAEAVGGRTAIVEAHPFWSWLFLNNNLHIVHHAHPATAWYDLPELYRERKSQYLAANGGYLFQGYGVIVRRFLLRSKQSLHHPLWYRDQSETQDAS
ncbi:MAG: fatty acid desaturase [Pseudomonadota bacterium]